MWTAEDATWGNNPNISIELLMTEKPVQTRQITNKTIQPSRFWGCIIQQLRWFLMKVTGSATSLSSREADTEVRSSCACWWDFSVEVKFKVKGSGAKRIETLESVKTSVKGVMMTLLALWIHWVFSVVKLGSHFWKTPLISVYFTKFIIYCWLI